MSFAQNLKLASATQRRFVESSFSSSSSLVSTKFCAKNFANASSSLPMKRRNSLTPSPMQLLMVNSNSAHSNSLESLVLAHNSERGERFSSTIKEKPLESSRILPAAFLGLFGSLGLVLSSSAFFSVGTSGEREEEKERMNKRLNRFGFVERKMIGDGNCLFRSLHDQLNLNGMGGTKDSDYRSIRDQIVDWLESNENFKVDEETHLKNFLDLDEYPDWKAYCRSMRREGTWGDHLTLLAASELFNSQIQIVSSVKTGDEKDYQLTILNPKNGKSKQTLYLSHWHENHYNSLQKTDVPHVPTSRL